MEFSDIERTMMARCIELARRGAAEGEHPFGSVIANGAEVIAEASNRTVRDRDESRHAEILAVALARKSLPIRRWRAARSTPSSSLAQCAPFASGRRAFAALCLPCTHVLGGLSKWNILADRSLSRRIPCLFRAPPEIAHGVLADEAMQAWSDWRPLATQAIRLFGFFVKPKVGKINADGL